MLREDNDDYDNFYVEFIDMAFGVFGACEKKAYVE